MRVPANTDSSASRTPQDSEDNSSPKAKRKKHAQTANSAESTKTSKTTTANAKEAKGAETPVTHGSNASQYDHGRDEEEDTKVHLSAESKTLSDHTAHASSDKELKEAETLMKHVDGGNLSPSEHEMAMKRVGEIVKKYGDATVKGPSKSLAPPTSVETSEQGK